MGVYLCIGQSIHQFTYKDAIIIANLSFASINNYITKNDKIFIFLGAGQHKIKRKAEQIACNEALHKLNICPAI